MDSYFRVPVWGGQWLETRSATKRFWGNGVEAFLSELHEWLALEVPSDAHLQFSIDGGSLVVTASWRRHVKESEMVG